MHETETTTAEDGTPFRVVLEVDTCSGDLDPRHNGEPAGIIVALGTPDGRKWRPQEDPFGQRTHRRKWRPREDPFGQRTHPNAPTIIDAVQDHSFRAVSRWLRMFHGASVVLPLYEGTDGLTTGEPDDDAGPDEYRGVTFDTPATRKRGGWPEAVEYSTTREHLRMALEADVDEWATWARGDVWGIVVQRGGIDEGGELVWDTDTSEESVWGFIGQEYAEHEARRLLDDFVSLYDIRHPADVDA